MQSMASHPFPDGALEMMDDVAVQREVASDVLGMPGYDIHTAASREAALEYDQHRVADLVLLDMIMESGINGLATYQRML